MNESNFNTGLLHVALKINGTTQKEWCEARGIQPNYFYGLMTRQSALADKVRADIAKEIAKAEPEIQKEITKMKNL